jgi:AraC family transcriptional regulator of adaptative response/methylated-DNA-[protein]-cysteine methyltransferase
VQSVCRLIERATEERPNMDAVGERLKLSRSHLQRLFKKLMGITPREYAEALRIDRLMTPQLEVIGGPISNIINLLGYALI